MSLKSYALTTEQRVADFLGLGTLVANSATYNIIQILINQITEFIENYIGWRIMLSTYTSEEYDGEGTDTLYIKHYPIGTFSALQVRTSGDSTDSWETIDSDQYHVYEAEGYIRFIGTRVFMLGKQNYRVTYTAGYNFNNTSTFLSDTEAGDIEYVAWKLIASAYERRKAGSGIKSESIGDYRVEYRADVMEDEEIKAILDKYRRLESISYATPSNV